MNTFPPRRTRLELHFHLLGFSVRVHPGFWLVHVGIASFVACVEPVPGLHPVVAFLITFLCTTGSILLHELGHVLPGWWFGADGEIDLSYFGGLAGVGLTADSRRRRVIVILAGPLASLTVAAVAGVVHLAVRPSDEELHREAIARYPATVNQSSPIPTAPVPPARAAEDAFALLFLLNVLLVLFSLMSHPGTDMGALIKEYDEWRRGRDEPDCEKGEDGWKRE